MQDPEKHNNFYFVSDSGTRFDVDFTNNDSIIPSGAYEFGITNRHHERSPLDFKLRATIFSIIEEFFEVNGDETMLYLADTGDRKQAFRNRLFVRWFNSYEHRDLYYIQTAEGKMDGQMNFLAIISKKDNSSRWAARTSSRGQPTWLPGFTSLVVVTTLRLSSASTAERIIP